MQRTHCLKITQKVSFLNSRAKIMEMMYVILAMKNKMRHFLFNFHTLWRCKNYPFLHLMYWLISSRLDLGRVKRSVRP